MDNSAIASNDLRITTNGTLTTSGSDLRLKENISTLHNSLDRLLKLRGVSFSWIEDPRAGTQLGMIAQEVREVVPEIVFKRGEYYGIDYSEMSGLFVEAIKEQQGLIEQQAREIEIQQRILLQQGKRLDDQEKVLKDLKQMVNNLITESINSP